MRIRINYCRATDVCGAGSSPLRGEGFESSADFDLYKKHHQLSLHTQPKPIQNTSKKVYQLRLCLCYSLIFCMKNLVNKPKRVAYGHQTFKFFFLLFRLRRLRQPCWTPSWCRCSPSIPTLSIPFTSRTSSQARSLQM
jgi:hypothetical protein